VSERLWREKGRREGKRGKEGKREGERIEGVIAKAG